MARLPSVPLSVSTLSATASAPTARSIEWPTWVLLVCLYGGWLVLLVAHRTLGSWLFTGLLGVWIAWFMSLQHELVHGHPTRWDALNRWLGLLPVSIWYPFDLYRLNHLAHHHAPSLTQPGVDPESNYRRAEDVSSRWQRWLLITQRTVAGRLLVGPALCLAGLHRDLLDTLRHGRGIGRWSWLQHTVLAVGLLLIVQRWSGVSLVEYLVASYLGLGLALLRSLYEHRPATDPLHRIVVNEASWPWRLLYLNNNYHAVHHALPGLPWYQIPARYRADRDGYLHRNGGFLIPGYGRLIGRHFWRPIDSPVWSETA